MSRITQLQRDVNLIKDIFKSIRKDEHEETDKLVEQLTGIKAIPKPEPEPEPTPEPTPEPKTQPQDEKKPGVKKSGN